MAVYLENIYKKELIFHFYQNGQICKKLGVLTYTDFVKELKRKISEKENFTVACKIHCYILDEVPYYQDFKIIFTIEADNSIYIDLYFKENLKPHHNWHYNRIIGLLKKCDHLKHNFLNPLECNG